MHAADGFPVWLEATMRSRGLSQAQLARSLGVGEAQVSRWRRGLAVPTVRSLQRLAETLGVARTTLEELAGYPAAAPSEPGGRGWNAEQAGELHAHQARLVRLLEERVPPDLWPAYVAACVAMADALEESYAITLDRAERLLARRTRAPGDAMASPAPVRLHPERQLGFRAPESSPGAPSMPSDAQLGAHHGHPDGRRVDQPR